MKIKEIISGELKGWSVLETVWLGFCTVAILSVSIYCRDSIFSIFGALTGIWCTILTGKGKRSAFIFGVFNAALYSYISYEAKYYGEVMLNTMYFIPMNIIGWFVWSRHMNKETYEVEKSKLTRKKTALMYAITAVGIYIYGLVLKSMGGNLPYIDSMSTVVSVTAQILSVKRMAQQWMLWTFVNAVTVVMWAIDVVNGGNSIAIVIMWSIYLINGIIMFVKWNRELASM